MNRMLCAMLFLAFAAYGQEQERVAIIPPVDDRDSIDVSDLGYFADKLRDMAGKVLPKSRYNVVTQQGTEECGDTVCLAGYISRSRIGRFGGELMTIKVELRSTGSDSLIGSFTGDSKDLRGLLSVLESKAPKLFEELPGASPAAPEEPAPDSAAAPAAKKECANKFNINELVFRIGKAFPNQLRDCSATLAKDIALSKSPFGKKTELKEPKAFITQCVMDGMKKELLAGTEEYLKLVEGFTQNILNAASAAGGGLDAKMLPGVIGGVNVNDLVKEIKIKAFKDKCAVNEPWEPPAALEDKEEGEGLEGKKDKRKVFSWGLRGGFNFSYLYAIYDNDYHHGSGTYESTPAGQFGLVLDWALNDKFHLQPGLMFIEKGTEDGYMRYIEIPLLLSLKFSALRINAGPYFGIYVAAHVGERRNFEAFSDLGLSAGFGFDIWKFYIGMFYDYGLTESYNYSYHEIDNNIHISHSLKAYNRTLGFNLGVNL